MAQEPNRIVNPQNTVTPTPQPSLVPQPPKAPEAAKPGMTQERQSVIAQHFLTTPVEKRPELLAHFRQHANAEEKAFVEKLAGSRN